MARRKSAEMDVRIAFEASRIASQCLADAYDPRRSYRGARRGWSLRRIADVGTVLLQMLRHKGADQVERVVH